MTDIQHQSYRECKNFEFIVSSFSVHTRLYQNSLLDTMTDFCEVEANRKWGAGVIFEEWQGAASGGLREDEVTRLVSRQRPTQAS